MEKRSVESQAAQIVTETLHDFTHSDAGTILLKEPCGHSVADCPHDRALHAIYFALHNLGLEHRIATALTLAHQQGRVEEREACAKVAETFTVPCGCDEPYCLGWETAERGIAAALRGRGSHDV